MDSDVITSTRNPRIRSVVRLRAHHGAARQKEIVIDGCREVRQAVESGVDIHEAFSFWCDSSVDGNEETALLELLRQRSVPLTKVSEAVFRKIAYGERRDGVVAVGARPRVELQSLRLRARPLIGVLEGVEKPGNLGAVLRSADGAGLEAILAVDPITDVYGPNVIRSSLGCVFSVPVVETSARHAIEWLISRGITVVAADPSAARAYTELDLTAPVAFVFGNEAKGLTATWKRPDVLPASVPMLGRADSLNVSITAALFFYEALRQRRG